MVATAWGAVGIRRSGHLPRNDRQPVITRLLEHWTVRGSPPVPGSTGSAGQPRLWVILALDRPGRRKSDRQISGGRGRFPI